MPGISHARNTRDMEYLSLHCPYEDGYWPPMQDRPVCHTCGNETGELITYFELAPISDFQRQVLEVGIPWAFEQALKARKEAGDE